MQRKVFDNEDVVIPGVAKQNNYGTQMEKFGKRKFKLAAESGLVGLKTQQAPARQVTGAVLFNESLNETGATKKGSLSIVNSQKRMEMNQRRMEAQATRQYMAQGFQQTFKATVKAIQENAQAISAKVESMFADMQNKMDDLNRQMVVADENTKRNLKVLQYDILNTQKQIAEVKVQIGIWLREMEQANEERQQELIRQIEEANRQNAERARLLGERMGEVERNLGNQIQSLAESIGALTRDINRGFEEARRQAEAQRQQLQNQLNQLRQNQQKEREAILQKIANLQEDNEEILLITCWMCGASTGYVCPCTLQNGNSYRREFKLTKGQLKKLNPSSFRQLNPADKSRGIKAQYYYWPKSTGARNVTADFRRELLEAGVLA